VALKLQLEQMTDDSATQHQQTLAECLNDVGQCLLEVRTISHLLHPPLLDEAGLLAAAQWYVDEFSRHSKMPTIFDAPGQMKRLPHEMEIVLFWALQENLTNVFRHSKSLKVAIRLGIDNEKVSLMVQDYGSGLPSGMVDRFRNNENGFGVGLVGMRERVHELRGSIDLQSDRHGTTITVTLPLFAGNGNTERFTAERLRDPYEVI
jgi:signal transduction histidine kinase